MTHIRPSSRRSLPTWCAGCLLLASASLARAEEPRAAGAGGMVVSIDAKTGELRAPTVEEITALTRQTALRAVAPQPAPLVELRADGTLMAQVPEDYMEYALLGLGADGKPVASCLTGAAEAERWVALLAARPLPAAAALETE